ncbi:DUF998 domain-containing protein [Brevibacillus reuszeri]|uniref:DUF998 domain-containing protein n=1 Tax=Brevibacillus reuszeri TaxID=54915 RepID=UPI00289B09C2|nr:DUF998 domain-containing protein [Brevibacillus reuszeri]
MKEKVTAALLRMGIAVPIIYFGIPIVAAPYYPGYSFVKHTASELGSNRAVHPDPVNAAIIILGIVTLLAAFGFLLALYRLGTNPLLAWLTMIVVVSHGLGSLLSGIFPIPDPRHGGGALSAGMFLVPFIFAFVLWKRSNTRLLKGYLIANIILFVAMVPIMSGIIEMDRSMIAGLLQRILAFTAFTPIGVGAYVLMKCLKNFQKLNHVMSDKFI